MDARDHTMSREVFESLLAPHLLWVRTFVRTRLRTIDHADDLVQQTLLRAFVCRHQLRCPSKFRSWIGTIALNEVRAYFRSLRPGVSLNEFPSSAFADRAPSPLARCVQLEREHRLRAGMATLPARDRVAIRLVDFKGLSYAEAAGAMTVSTAAFKSTHYRALQRLGRALREASPAERADLPRAA
jgi:RNA polymerase sigma-70 factor (ECF subfamily)